MATKKSTSRGRAATTKPKSAPTRKPRSNQQDASPVTTNWAEQPGVRLLAALIAGLVVGMVASSGLRSVAAGHSQPASWQYGRLSVSPSGATWSAPHREHSAAELKDLYRQLTGTQPQSEVTPTEITSLIGARGWELVSVTYGDKRSADNYWFRRPS